MNRLTVLVLEGFLYHAEVNGWDDAFNNLKSNLELIPEYKDMLSLYISKYFNAYHYINEKETNGADNGLCGIIREKQFNKVLKLYDKLVK